jgi:hypothetical protein
MTMLTGRRLIGSMDNWENLTAIYRYGIAAIMLNKSLFAVGMNTCDRGDIGLAQECSPYKT